MQLDLMLAEDRFVRIDIGLRDSVLPMSRRQKRNHMPLLYYHPQRGFYIQIDFLYSLAWIIPHIKKKYFKISRSLL